LNTGLAQTFTTGKTLLLSLRHTS